MVFRRVGGHGHLLQLRVFQARAEGVPEAQAEGREPPPRHVLRLQGEGAHQRPLQAERERGLSQGWFLQGAKVLVMLGRVPTAAI